MSRNPSRSDHSTTDANPQKYKWTQKKSFDNFNDADTLRNQLKEEGYVVKVKRHGTDGTLFKVVVGAEIKKSKKEKVNAPE